jgi:phosphohistidine phosphatase
MKYLTLVRHAKSSWDNPGQLDHERTLTERGQRNAPEMARFLAKTYFGLDSNPAILPAPDHLIASSAVRTQQTAALMQAEMKLPEEVLRTEPRAYLAEANSLLDIVQNFDDSWQSIMLFAHNNGISDFANQLLKRNGIGDMPTCAAAILELPVISWHSVTWRQARLIGYLTPKLIVKRFPTSELPTPFDLD